MGSFPVKALAKTPWSAVCVGVLKGEAPAGSTAPGVLPADNPSNAPMEPNPRAFPNGSASWILVVGALRVKGDRAISVDLKLRCRLSLGRSDNSLLTTPAPAPMIAPKTMGEISACVTSAPRPNTAERSQHAA